MLVALLGPHQQWSVCLTGMCSDAVTATVASGCCCEVDQDADRGKGDGENRGDCCPGCCLDLAMTIEEGPLPNPVQSPEVNDSAVATLPPGLSPPSSATASRYGGHDTGPPRTDQRTDLIATTVLRE